jgi:hypothetical protein
MTTRNFFVNHGLECGDIVISASNNTITGLSTAAPTADGDVANKKYVDDQASASLVFTNKTFDANGTGNSLSNVEVADFAAGVLDTDLSTVSASDDTVPSAKATKAYVDGQISAGVDTHTTITEGNSSVVVADSGTGTITVSADGGTVASFASAATTITASGAINLTAGTDVQIPANVGVLFGTGGEKIESDGTDLTITSTGALQLTVTGTTTVSGALTVTGDLTVNGTTTTVNSTNTTLDDNLLELNSGAASNANDSGFIIERGSTGDNAIFMWDESADKFTLGTTTATASDTGDLSITTGTLVAATFEGDLTGDVTGNADTATEATNVTVTANNTANETVYLTFVDGDSGTQGIEVDTGLSYNPNTNVLSTTASQAQYADLAEKYTTDQEYAVGTVMMVNTADASEVTSITTGNIAVGVISAAPAYLMNADSEGQAVALKGRVPVCVNGAVTKGQPVYVDDGGCATASDSGSHMVGIALESNSDSGTKLVECILKV